MGTSIRAQADALFIEGRGWDGLSAPEQTIDCGNSGTTMRLLSGVLAGRPFGSRLDGDASLRRRPMQRIIDPLTRMGARIFSADGKGFAPLAIHGGQLHGIEYQMPMASAQVKSAILLAALQAQGITTVVAPQNSRDHTELMIRGFGGEITTTGASISLSGGQMLRARDVRIPGDISSAAFFLVAAAIAPGSEVVVRDVGINPSRAGVLEVLRRMKARVELLNERVETGEPVADIKVSGDRLVGVEIAPEMSAKTIDEYPILAVAGALARGVTTMSGVKELRYKESDRIAAMSQGLRALGVTVEEQEDGMVIEGRPRLRGAAVKSYGDHRVAMSLAIAGLFSDGGIEIDDGDCVDISFPTFYELLQKIYLH